MFTTERAEKFRRPHPVGLSQKEGDDFRSAKVHRVVLESFTGNNKQNSSKPLEDACVKTT